MAIPMVGKLWWVAPTLREATAWKAKYEGRGVSVKIMPPRDAAQQHRDVVLTLERHRAPELLGYEPDWLNCSVEPQT